MPNTSGNPAPTIGRELYLHIDPGFINFRKCFSAFDRELVAARFEELRAAKDDPMAAVSDNHLIVDLVLNACRILEVMSLAEVLRSPRIGELFCSTEDLRGAKDIHTLSRVRNQVILPYQTRPRVLLEFGTKHIRNDTGRAEQSARYKVSIVGQVREIRDSEIVLAPLIMGAPSLVHPRNENSGISMATLAFHGFDFYETPAEAIDEFAKLKHIDVQTTEEWMECMRVVSEDRVISAFAELLKEPTQKHSFWNFRRQAKRITAAKWLCYSTAWSGNA